jgi:hypothetical protein
MEILKGKHLKVFDKQLDGINIWAPPKIDFEIQR